MASGVVKRIIASAAVTVVLAACLEGRPLGPVTPIGANPDLRRPPASFDRTFERHPVLGERVQIRLYPDGYFTYTSIRPTDEYRAEGNYYWAVSDNSRLFDQLELRFSAHAGWEGLATIQDHSLVVRFTEDMEQIGFAGGDYRLVTPTAK